MDKNVLIDSLLEPLDGTKTAKVDINSGTGNLTIDPLTGDAQVLASGTLQYFEDQGLPTRTLDSSNGQTTLTLRRRETRRTWFHLPWEACIGELEWQIHLNPIVSSDIIAHSDGGNVKLDLAGIAATHVAADTGGGNVEVVLPDNVANLSATARTGGGNVTVEIGSGTTGNNTVDANSGAGNVVVHVPRGIAARVHARSGLGMATVDPRFIKIDSNTYQSPDYDGAASKVEITAHSGAGNVSIDTK
jgi:hypothetical protein